MTGFRRNGVIAVDNASAFAALDAGHEAEKLAIHYWDLAVDKSVEMIDNPAHIFNLGGEHSKIVGLQNGKLTFNTHLESHLQTTYVDGVAPSEAHAFAKLLGNAFGAAPLLKMGSTVVAGSTATAIEQQDEATDYAQGDIIAIEDQTTGEVETGYIHSTAALVHTLGMGLPNGAPAAGDIILGGIVCKFSPTLAYPINVEAIFEDDSLGVQCLGVQCWPTIAAFPWTSYPTVSWDMMVAKILKLGDISGAAQGANHLESIPLVGADGYFAISPIGGAQTRLPLDRLSLSIDFGSGGIDGHERPQSTSAGQRYSALVRTSAAIRIGLTTDPDFDPPGTQSTWEEAIESLAQADKRGHAHFQFGRSRGRTVSISLPAYELRAVTTGGMGADNLAATQIEIAPYHSALTSHSALVVGFH